MSERAPTIFLSAAEASGDEHAARLMGALRRRLGTVRFVGVAGPHMAAEGCEVLADFSARASMLGGPLLRLGYYVRAIRRLQRQIGRIRPDVHVPVDSPAMNWHLAAAARKAGSTVVYYIAPQVWAWAPWRVKKLARLTDHVACILPFEQRYFRDRGVAATFVGHPLLEALPPRSEPLSDLAGAWAHGEWKIAMLAGSRSGEIKANSKALMRSAKLIRRHWPAARCLLAARNQTDAETILAACKGKLARNAEIVIGQTAEVFAEAHFAIAKSGTNTLQAAHFGVPFVTFYRAGRLKYHLLGRWLIKTPHLCLANILAGRRIVPELMPWYGSERELSSMVIDTMSDLGFLFEARQGLLEVDDSLHGPGGLSASDNTANLVADLLDRRSRGG